jgi:hypothetical protein
VLSLSEKNASTLIPLESLEWFLTRCREIRANLEASPVRPSAAARSLAKAIVSDCEATVEVEFNREWTVRLSEYAKATDRQTVSLRQRALSPGGLTGAERRSDGWYFTSSPAKSGKNGRHLIRYRAIGSLVDRIRERNDALRSNPELEESDTLEVGRHFVEQAEAFADLALRHQWFVRLDSLGQNKHGKIRRAASRGQVPGASKLEYRWYRFCAPPCARA